MVPLPTPTSIRPLLRLSSSASWTARRTGWWKGSCTTAKPIRILSVRIATAEANSSGSLVDALAGEIMLGQPNIAEPEPFGKAHLLDLLVDALGVLFRRR